MSQVISFQLRTGGANGFLQLLYRDPANRVENVDLIGWNETAERAFRFRSSPAMIFFAWFGVNVIIDSPCGVVSIMAP